jgi:hypothetical protein
VPRSRKRRGIDRHGPATWCRSAKFAASSRVRDLSSDVTHHQRISSIPIIDRDHVSTLRVAPNLARMEFSVTTGVAARKDTSQTGTSAGKASTYSG